MVTLTAVLELRLLECDAGVVQLVFTFVVAGCAVALARLAVQFRAVLTLGLSTWGAMKVIRCWSARFGVHCLVLCGGLLLSTWSWASGELHLSFHMVIAHGGQAYVGGTLVNRGDAPVSHGYVVVTLIDAQCQPQESVLGNFGAIAPGAERELRIPLKWRFKRYRVTGLAAFDANSSELLVVDDHVALLQAREADEQAKCAQVREAASAQS